VNEAEVYYVPHGILHNVPVPENVDTGGLARDLMASLVIIRHKLMCTPHSALASGRIRYHHTDAPSIGGVGCVCKGQPIAYRGPEMGRLT